MIKRGKIARRIENKRDDEFISSAFTRTRCLVRKGRDPRVMVATAYVLGFEEAVKTLARLQRKNREYF